MVRVESDDGSKDIDCAHFWAFNQGLGAMESAKLAKRVRFFRRAVMELFLAMDDLPDHVPEGRDIRFSAVNLFQIAVALSGRYPGAGLGTEGETVDRKPGDWLQSKVGPDDIPTPPTIGSEYIKGLAARGLLTPTSLGAMEVQELAASIISRLAAEAGYFSK